MPHDLIQKLASKTAVIGVVGLGYVGLPLAIRFAEVGYKVVGLDIDPKKARYIAEARTYIEHIPDTDIRGRWEEGSRRRRTFPGHRKLTP